MTTCVSLHRLILCADAEFQFLLNEAARCDEGGPESSASDTPTKMDVESYASVLARLTIDDFRVWDQSGVQQEFLFLGSPIGPLFLWFHPAVWICLMNIEEY